MKFKDYEAARREQDEKFEQHNRQRPSTEGWERTVLTHRREWSLGKSSYVHRGGSHEALIVQFDHNLVGLQIGIGCISLDSTGYWQSVAQLGSHVPMTAASSAQWRLFAEIVATIEQWKAGEIDDLPPSGIWKDPKK